jgi:hypothetical protein
MSAEKEFMSIAIMTVRRGRTFGRFQFTGTLKIATRVAFLLMDEIVTRGDQGDAVQVIDRHGKMRFTRYRYG